MKKIVINIFLILTLISCEDILDLTPLDKISENAVWNDAALIQAYLNACYSAVTPGFKQGMLSSACDETYDIHNASGFYYIQQGALTSDNVNNLTSTLMNIWKPSYSKIRDINIFFKNIESSTINDATKKLTIGEMKFIRAYVYANLIWRYGGVPIIEGVFELNDDYTLSRSSYDACVDYIVSDLDDAISLLPAKQTGSNLGRASGDAARALKSRVLLYAASHLNNPNNDLTKWQKAADAAESLLNTGYSLNNDYQKTFLGENSEIIFARYYTQSNYHSMHLYNARNGDHGWGGDVPSHNLVSDYEMDNGELPYLDAEQTIVNPASEFNPANPYINRDPRFYASILYDGAVWRGRETETYAGGMDSRSSTIEAWNATLTGYYTKKFLQEELPPTGGSLNSTSPWIFFRYAEILLNYAEAKFELGDESTARQYINLVRSRPGVQMPEVTAGGTELRAKIQHERRIELVFEDHRYFDVRRWGIAAETETIDLKKIDIIKNQDGSKTYTVGTLLDRAFSPQHFLLPIPRTEVDKSKGSLVQNPNYD